MFKSFFKRVITVNIQISRAADLGSNAFCQSLPEILISYNCRPLRDFSLNKVCGL
jgi:hypothetical protein